ncbi:hypothetical protein I8752_31100 [Nostocaceae cyanobacterium CENA369]|uniref:Uncharacterized protein n=1 Tax=Dendronalium phyllosphericum CENA369 TaxID=1725256 RepID=A0A8J7IQZ6_9NOST|nr:hypothetical protein [Dendronalium phyllosphericum]MBH8577337.1 hypothetical protein [Dendronalium phyllosphericum CENA369]
MTTAVVLEKDRPYLILWRDNFDGDVAIKLYDGEKLVQNISDSTASDGIFEWTPYIPLKKGYSVRISQKDRKIFGQL